MLDLTDIDLQRMGGKGSTDGIREILRGEIVAGRLAPGERLPTHVELATLFGVSNLTIQHALKRLAADGFIHIKPRVGSFVVDQPPHRRNIGLVFPFDPTTPAYRSQWSLYYESLAAAARQVESDLGRCIRPFHGIDHHSDSEDRERLLRHIERRQLAGLIFAGAPFMYKHTPLVDAPDLPRVELSSAHTAPWPVINIHSFAWFETALDRLAGRGRQRVAILFHRLQGNSLYAPDRLAALAAERGLTTQAPWQQGCSWRDQQGTRHTVQLLMAAPPEQRPDALLITDDNLITGAAEGLRAAGIHAPDDMTVVASANFPLPGEPPSQLDLLGYDLCTVLRRAISCLDGQATDAAQPRTIQIPPTWYNHHSTHDPKEANLCNAT